MDSTLTILITLATFYPHKPRGWTQSNLTSRFTDCATVTGKGRKKNRRTCAADWTRHLPCLSSFSARSLPFCLVAWSAPSNASSEICRLVTGEEVLTGGAAPCLRPYAITVHGCKMQSQGDSRKHTIVTPVHHERRFDDCDAGAPWCNRASDASSCFQVRGEFKH